MHKKYSLGHANHTDVNHVDHTNVNHADHSEVDVQQARLDW